MEKELMYKGKEVYVHRLKNADGMTVDITNFGARILSIMLYNRWGTKIDVVLGYEYLDDYFPENNSNDFGAVVGRYANRLAKGQITIDGKIYQLPQNDGENCLHGGPDGWQYRVYDVISATDNKIVLAMTSPDSDNGFPGEVKVKVTYTLSDDNALRIDYEAKSDSTTVINMTNHSYFNLNGHEGEEQCSALNHYLQIDADKYLPIGKDFIPLGDPQPVGEMSFLNEWHLCDLEFEKCEQTALAGGLDHCWVLNHPGDLERPAAVINNPASCMKMEVYTTEPGIQVYTANFLDCKEGKYGHRYKKHDAICLETEQFPDSPNRNWPQSTGMLSPKKPYKSTTVYRFLVTSDQ